MAVKLNTTDPRICVLHAVEPLKWGLVRTEGERVSQEVVVESDDWRLDGQTLLLHCTVPLLLRELPTEVQHRPVHVLHLLGQNRPQLPIRGVCLQNKKEA